MRSNFLTGVPTQISAGTDVTHKPRASKVRQVAGMAKMEVAAQTGKVAQCVKIPLKAPAVAQREASSTACAVGAVVNKAKRRHHCSHGGCRKHCVHEHHVRREPIDTD